MRIKLAILAILLCLLVSVFGPGSANAQGPITVQSSTTQAAFPNTLTFNISTSSSTNVTDIRLRYSLVRDSFAKSFSEAFVKFTPAVSVKASWVLDMKKTGGLPTGTSLNYWWVIKDTGGNHLETSPKRVDFNDNRFQWQSMTQGLITLYWYQGDSYFLGQLMTTAQEALTRLQASTGARVTTPVKIYIYGNQADMLGSMIFPQGWEGGVHYPGYGIIIIAIPASQLAWGMGAMTHELTHLVINEITSNPYNDLPTWLEEGLAVYNEVPVNPTKRLQLLSALNQAISAGQLITMRSLTSTFSAYGEAANLSYAESYSFVDYLISTYGQQRMLQLLNVFQQGSTYDSAFQKVYGFNMDSLYTVWKQKVSAPKTGAWAPGQTPSWDIFSAIERSRVPA